MMRLLLVEEDEAFASKVRSWLSLHYEITTVGTLASAIEALKSGKWDCVLLAMHLPNGKGIPVVREVEKVAHRLPVVVFTGAFPRDVEEKVIEAGAQEFRLKGETDKEGLLHALTLAVIRKQVEHDRMDLDAAAADTREGQDSIHVAVNDLKEAMKK